MHPVYHLDHFPHTSYLTPSQTLTLSLPPTSCLFTPIHPSIFNYLHLSSHNFLPRLLPVSTSQPTFSLRHYSHFHLPDSLLLSPSPPAGSRCYRTVRRRRWIRPSKGTNMSARTTSCRSWPRRSSERSRGWRETTCAVTAGRPVSDKDGESRKLLWS